MLGCISNSLIWNMATVTEEYFFPQQCIFHCFSNGYENAHLMHGGICSCGDAGFGYSPTEKISFINRTQNMEYCNIPCKTDRSRNCGGDSFALLYQKPGEHHLLSACTSKNSSII